MAKRKMRILYVTAEAAPYLTVGGLGEVGGTFPRACAALGTEISRVMPCYQGVPGDTLKVVRDFVVPFGDAFETCILRQDKAEKQVPTYFLDNARFFYREQVYGYPDDGVRFFFFCRAVVEMIKTLRFKPDIVHLNDWHTGFLALLLKHEFPGIQTIFTIHNMRYQGFLPPEYLKGVLTEKELFLLGWPEWLNFMKAGIAYSDSITTVSPGYAEEITEPPHDFGMAPLLARHPGGIAGILNGIDTDGYNPASDGVLTYPYDARRLENKVKNKGELRQSLGLYDREVPLVAMVTRLDDAKGMDLMIKVLPKLDAERMQIVVLGSGSLYYQGLMSNLAHERQGMMAVCFAYHPDLARRIYAAADMYLMPSQIEPCGIGQMIAQRYGAVPVVSPVGGLKDTVLDYEAHGAKATGFFIHSMTPGGLLEAIQKALAVYSDKEWKRLIKNCMAADFSWTVPAAAYQALYAALYQKTK